MHQAISRFPERIVPACLACFPVPVSVSHDMFRDLKLNAKMPRDMLFVNVVNALENAGVKSNEGKKRVKDMEAVRH